MNGPDFFFSSPSATVHTSTVNEGEDDDWGEFVDSSPRIDSLSPSADQNGANSAPDRIESEKKIHTPWVTSRGPVPLSVFGEDEEEDESGASVSLFDFSFGSFSGKHNDSTGSVNKVVNTNPTAGINGLIANLYRENGQIEPKNRLDSPGNRLANLEMNGNLSHGLNIDLSRSSSSQKIENSAVSLENLNWNPLNLDTERSEKTNNVVNSSTIEVTLNPNYLDLGFDDKDEDGVDDGWEFKTAESMLQTADGGSKEEREDTKTESVVVQNTTPLSSSIWSSSTNGTGANFDIGKVDSVKSVFDRENVDNDPWVDGGWELKVAQAGELKQHLTNKESNGWEFGSDLEPISKIETTASSFSNFEKVMQNRENGSLSFPSNADVDSGGTSWAFKQPDLEFGNKKEEKVAQTEKPKGVLPLSFFEDEKLGTSDTFFHEDNLDSVCDFSLREKTKAPSSTMPINDLISSLYSQMEEKNAANQSENSDRYGFVSEKAATDYRLENGEDGLWKFQGPTKAITDSSIEEGVDDFDSSWEFQGPSVALNNSVVAGVDEFDDDSWEFQGPTQLVKDSTTRKEDTDALESKQNSVENGVGNQLPAPNGYRELHEKPVISVERIDYQDVFHMLKTELYYITLKHLQILKEARDLAADSDEVTEFKKCDDEIQDLQNWLNNDALICELNGESLQPRPSHITELSKALQEPNFRALDSEDHLSERLSLAEKDWKITIELLKHVSLNLKILNLGSSEQQSSYASTWFIIASTCMQELQHATSIWKEVIKNDVQKEILSKPQGKSYFLSVGEIYEVAKILRVSIRLYKPWILLAPTSSNVPAVLDGCVKLWKKSGLEETLLNNLNRKELDSDYSADSIEVDPFGLHKCITSATLPTCYISGLNTEIVPGMKMVEWKGEHYLLPLANLWANLISREPPSLPGHNFPTVS